MKTFSTLFFVLFLTTTYSQSLISVNPNVATAGTTLTATITGQNTFFMTGSPQGAQSIHLGQQNCVNIQGSNLAVIDDDHMSVDFTIPAGWPNGNHPIVVNRYYDVLTLQSGITISGGQDYSLQTFAPSTAVENSTVNATITGQNLQALSALPGFTLRLYFNGYKIYPATNISAINANTLTADFQFLPYCDTGYGTLQIISSVGCFTLQNAIHVQGNYPKQLVAINPSQGNAGTPLTAIITAQNTYFMSASPQGVQSIELIDQHCKFYPGSNLQIIDEDHFSADFSIPATATNGIADVYATTTTYHTYILPAAFTITGGVDRNILSFSPSTGVANTTVTATITGNDLVNLADSVKLVSAGGFVIKATNISANSTSATMDFPIPIYADNGFYELRTEVASGCFKLPQAIQISGGAPRGIVSITPNQGARGQTLSAVITGSYTFFMTGTPPGGVRRVQLSNTSMNQYMTFYPPDVSVIDSDHVALNLTIPFSARPGLYNVTVETYGGTFYHLNPGFEITGTRLQGKIYFDRDSNGVYSPGDIYLQGRKVLLLPDSTIAITDPGGEYNFTVDSGQYTIGLFPDSNWYVTSTPSSYTLTVDSVDSLGLSLGVLPYTNQYEMYTTIIGSIPRCFQTAYYDLVYKNLGTASVSGSVYFIPDSNLTFLSANPPYNSMNGDTVFWNYDSLDVYESNTIFIIVQMPAAGITINSIAHSQASDVNGNILAESSDSLTQLTVCSYDPNDKSVEPPGILNGHYVLRNEWLEYLIRFQNTGTDTAFQVIVLDTLDASLDPSSMQIIASSHNVECHLQSNVAEFRFNNIMLPDSNVDEPASHGYIKFRIRPLNSVSSGALVNNNAGIYFDLNQPVITNTVYTTLVDQLPVGIVTINDNKNILVYPNPSSDRITIKFENNESQKFISEFFDMHGRMIKRLITHDSSFVIDLREWSSGVYFIRLQSEDGKVNSKGKLIVR